MRKNNLWKRGLLIFVFFSILIVVYLIVVKINFQKNNYDTFTNSTGKDSASVMKKINNLDNGIYYFGYPDCPWCKELVPVLNGLLEKNNLKANFVNIHEASFNEKYKEILLHFYLQHTSQKKVIVPLVVTITNKKIATHIGTVKNHDANKRKMTHQQVSDLRKKLMEMLRLVSDNDLI